MSGRDISRTYLGKMRAQTKETDHAAYFWRVDGRVVLRTELSTPFDDLAPNLVAHIARKQLRLPDGAKQLRELVNCTMTAEDWQQHLAREAAAGTRRIL